MATDYSHQGAMLLREAPLPESGVWWTNVDRLQQRAYDPVTTEPNISDTKQYTYTLNSPPGGSNMPGVREDVPAYDDNARDDSGAATESISTYGGLFDSDTDNMTKPETNRDMLQRRRSEWQREFDLKDEWNDSWTDYRLHSSIHGVRHAAEPQQPFVIRRVIWTMLLLALSAVFLYLTVQAIQVYLTWPVVLHVNTVHQTSARYPAVTLCNQNSFRVTAATEQGWFQLLSEMYSRDLQAPPADAEAHGATNTSMFLIYNLTAHSKTDMIADCKWDGMPCDEADFQTVYTDHGVCFTFNSGADGINRYSSHTGSGSGLTLLINLEQYEYMSGPHSGAGLKLLVHRQQETPFIQQNGLTLPKGSHSLIGLKYMTTEQLPAPHGSCKSKQLVHYKEYSRTSCVEDCRQIYLHVRCGCRSFYMPDRAHRADNDSVPYCTVGQHLSCVRPAEDEFNLYQIGLCKCPVPCRQHAFDVQTSLGAVSNFEVLNMLYSGTKDSLHAKHINAKKITDRAFKDVSEADTKLIQQFVTAVRDIEQSLQTLLGNMEQAATRVDTMLQSLAQRSDFHEIGGFRRLSSYLHHAFMVGWERYKERALGELENDMYSVADTYEMVMVRLGGKLDETTVNTLWLIMDNILRGRIDLTRLAEDYVTRTYDAFLTGTPILPEYRETYKGRFDDAFIDISILAGEIKDNPGGAEWVRDKLLQDIKKLRTDLSTMQKLGSNAITGKAEKPDRKEIREASEEYVKQTKTFILRMDNFEEKIIANLEGELEKKLDVFHRANISLHQTRTDLNITLSIITNLIQTFNTTVWRDILNKAAVSQDYLDNPYAAKNQLAAELTSRALLEKLGDFDIFFSAIRARGRDLTDRWMELMLRYHGVWTTMLGETSLEPFYKLIADAFKTYAEGVKAFDSDIVNNYASLLADLLDILPYQFKQIEVADLMVMLNADFFELDADQLMESIDASFGELINSTDVMGALANLDMEFQYAFDQYEQSMEEFIQANKIEEQFYVDNMMRVDVFMRDLDSDVIKHQPAYDYVNLLGDVGGLLSLFLGASVLAILELLDLAVHHLFKWIMAHDPTRQ